MRFEKKKKWRYVKKKEEEEGRRGYCYYFNLSFHLNLKNTIFTGQKLFLL